MVLFLVFFAVGGALASIWYYRRYRTVRGRIKVWKRSILDRLPTKRGPVVAEAKIWATEAIQRNASTLMTQRAAGGSATDEAARQEAAERSEGMRGFARMLTPFEIVGQWVLAAAAFPQFSLWLNGAIGAAITGGIWYATFRALRMWHDPDAPTRSIRVARWIAGLTSAVAAIGGAVYATGRFALPGYFADLEAVIFACLIALAEIGPIASGAASFGAWVAEKSVRAAKHVSKLEDETDQLNAFMEWLQGISPVVAEEVRHG